MRRYFVSKKQPSMYQYSYMAPTLSGQNYKFLFVLDTTKTPPNTHVFPENRKVVLKKIDVSNVAYLQRSY